MQLAHAACLLLVSTKRSLSIHPTHTRHNINTLLPQRIYLCCCCSISLTVRSKPHRYQELFLAPRKWLFNQPPTPSVQFCPPRSQKPLTHHVRPSHLHTSMIARDTIDMCSCCRVPFPTHILHHVFSSQRAQCSTQSSSSSYGLEVITMALAFLIQIFILYLPLSSACPCASPKISWTCKIQTQVAVDVSSRNQGVRPPASFSFSAWAAHCH